MKPTAHQMASMLNDYFADPNCYPHLWIDDDAINWDLDSQKLFVELAIKIKNGK